MGDEVSARNIAIGAVVLVTLAAVILTGVALIDEYEDILKQTTPVVNESVTTSSGVATLANDDVDTDTFILLANETVTIVLDNYTEADIDRVSLSTQGTLTLNDTVYTDGIYNISYTYAADTSGSLVAGNFTTGLAIFGSFVGILAISLIGFVIVRLFKKK